ncbi:MAG: dicarboxylate/amino acid:cation symporter [Desulfovibrio sp.]|jgi:DAACS family dicarboxylate/amino acid:cation (Na+ or H+) symporter|nr:dicarboxylate/amino acid:cation symporter [Desulfovibrio sp.]
MTATSQEKLGLPAQMGIGLVLGAIVGVIIQNVPGVEAAWFKPVGDLFIRLIRMIVVPLVFCSIVSGAASMGNASKLGSIAVRCLVYFLLTTVVAVAIGLVVANVLQPGAGIPLPSSAADVKKVTPPNLVTTLLNIVPLNPFEALASGNLLQVLFFAIILGFILSAMGEKTRNVSLFFEEMNHVMTRLTSIIMKVAPIGVFALIAFTVGSFGIRILLPLIMLIVAVYLAALIHIFAVYIVLVKSFTKVSLKRYFQCMAEPLLLAFTTCSSVAALPANMRASRKLGAGKDVTSFAIPLGTTVNMDGAALYLGIATIFVAEVYGIPLSFNQQITVLLMSLLASIGSVGVPGSALVVMTMVFAQIGLPMEGIALVAGIDRILDMARTTLNVMGDSTGAIIVSHASGEVDPEFAAEES